MVTLDGGWVKDEQIYNVHRLNNLTGSWEAKSNRVHLKCRCKLHLIAVNIFSRCECSMDFICRNLC